MTPDTPLKGLPLAVIDVEATGLDEESRAVEVAVAHLTFGDRATPRLAYASRVRPPVPMSAGASRITGITDEDLVDAPTWDDGVGAAVEAACADRVPVAYNAPADSAWLFREGLDLGWPWIDAQVAAKVVDQYERRKGLEHVALRRGIVVDAHGAAGDAICTALLLPQLLTELWTGWDLYRDRWEGPSERPRTLGELLAWTEAVALYQERDFVQYQIRQGRMRTRPDCPWHELADKPLPYWPEREEPTGRCTACGGSVRWQIAQNGTVRQVETDGGDHRCE